MKRYIKIGLFFAPFILGLIGFTYAGVDMKDAAFNSLLLYFLNYGDSAGNAAIEVARWTAPIATASGLISLIVKYAIAVRNFIRNWSKDSVAVYGDDDDAEYVKEQLGSRLIVPYENRYVKAHKYVLMMEDDRNLKFYSAYREKLKNAPVSIRSSKIPSQELSGDKLIVYNPEETAARLFWKQSGIYELAEACNYQLRIAIIGFDKLGQEILLKGLQNNIFSPNQRIEYHIYGECTGFREMYRFLDKIEDPVFFHDTWFQDLETIRNADMIIVAYKNDEISTVRDIAFAVAEKKLYVLSENEELLQLLDIRERLITFNWRKNVLRPEYLFKDTLIEKAKKINLRYAHLYNGIEETPQNADAEWTKLNSFTKYSNISSADYHEVRMQMLKRWNLSTAIDAIPDERLESLAVLEHMRWCRYHYLANWTYGVPENGKQKDPNKRIHVDLVPYEQLSEAERKKDKDTVKVMLGLE